MSQNPPEEERFKTNVLDLTELIRELAATCWDAGVKDVNPSLVKIAGGFLSGYDGNDLVDVFIKYSHMHWHKIKDRKENFFMENANDIFKQLPIDTNNINAFKMFFTAKNQNGSFIIIPEDREAIWEIFDSLVKICIKYIHRVRGITYVPTDDGLVPKYKKKLYPYVDISKLAKEWNVKLEYPGQ